MAANNKLIGILINIVKTGSGDKQAVSALKSVQKVTMQAAAIFGTLAAAAVAVQRGLDATVGEFMRYATTIRDVSNATGMGAEETSKFIQILDDLRVGQEDVTKVMKAMVQNGIEPSIENLALLSDQYLALDSDVARSKFLLDNFGKAGFQMAEAMLAGSDAIRQMQADVAKGLIMTDADLKRAEELRLSIDSIGDSFEGVKVSAGGFIARLMEVTGTVDFLTDSFEGWSRTFKTFSKAFDLAEALRELGDMRPTIQIVRDLTRGTYENTNLLHQAFLNLAGSAGGAEEALRGVGDAEGYVNDGAAALAAGLRGEYESAYAPIDQLNQKNAELGAQMWGMLSGALPASEEAWADLYATYDETNASLAEAKRHLRDVTNEMMFQAVAAHLDTKGQLALARSLGLISEADYALMNGLEDLTAQYDKNGDGIVDATENQKEYIQRVEELRNLIAGLPPMTVITVVTNFVTNGSPPDTGGGGSSDSGSSDSGGPHDPDTESGGHAMGGVTYGSPSGHWELLHGTEAVVPLPDGRTIPVRIVGGEGMGGMVINVQQVIVESGDSDDNVFAKFRQAGGRR